MNINAIVNAVRNKGGATVSVTSGNAPIWGYAVAWSETTEEIIPSPEFYANAESIIRRYVSKHVGALHAPANYLGVWEHEGNVFLDISQVFDDEETAIKAGTQRNQIAIYEITTGTEIATGGVR